MNKSTFIQHDEEVLVDVFLCLNLLPILKHSCSVQHLKINFVRCLTKFVTLQFENLSMLSRYFTGLKDTLNGLVMQNVSETAS